MKRILAVVFTAVLAIIGMASTAQAVTVPIGNPATDRAFSDTWNNFTVVDTNHPAAFDGYFTSVTYYAEVASQTIRFAVVDANDEVTWVSDEITPLPDGIQTATFATPVGVTAGSNLGVYSKAYGTVGFDVVAGAEPASFEWYDSGVPSVGETLTYAGFESRVYSMNAAITASSPQICKNGGGEGFGYPNQGQCIASVVANSQAGK